jgi:hypothetical protein
MLAVVLFAISAGLLHRPILAALLCALALALVLASFRRKAPAAPDALYTSSADWLTDHGTQLPGQLSITSTALTWLPSRYSRRHGRQPVRIDALECREVSLQRGVGLLDVILTVAQADGSAVRLLTHRSRRLGHALTAFRLSLTVDSSRSA